MEGVLVSKSHNKFIGLQEGRFIKQGRNAKLSALLVLLITAILGAAATKFNSVRLLSIPCHARQYGSHSTFTSWLATLLISLTMLDFLVDHDNQSS